MNAHLPSFISHSSLVIRHCVVLALSFLVIPSFAETVQDRAGAVRNDRSVMEKDGRWIYNDWQRGFKEAAAKKKPLLVVLRCVPCLSCAGIDASVLNEPELGPLLDQFVCVRLINANTIDLSKFQFDYDLSFSTMFFNSDGTVYGRYGSWTHQKDPYDKTTRGYKQALESALAIHQGYPANKDALKGKQGAPLPFTDPLEIPELAGKYKRELDWDGKVLQSCVHCHMVGDALRSYYRDRDQKKSIPMEFIYPMPNAEAIGLTLDPGEVARVKSVATGSAAAKAGVQAGDEFVTLAGQPLVSIADVSWILHRTPESGSLAATIKHPAADGVNRRTETKSLQLVLPADWRMKSDISRRVGTWTMRAMAAGGLQLEDLSNEERTARGVDDAAMALFVKHAGEYGTHAAAKKAGFRKGDVIVQLDGLSSRVTESEMIGRLLQKHSPGDKVKAVVLRDKERVELALPIQ